MRGNRGAHRLDFFGAGVPVRKPAEGRDQGPVGIVAGQFVGLCVIQVLKPVFEVAQEHICACQVLCGLVGQQALFGQQRKDFKGRSHGQRLVPSAADELQRLGHELDFADPAGAELDVVGEVPSQDFAAHFGMQCAHGRQRCVVEVLAKHEGTADRLEFSVAAPGQRPRLDPGVALPLAAVRHEITLQGVEADGQGPCVAVRPKAHVHAEHKPVAGLFVEQRNDPAAEANEILVGGERSRPVGLPLVGIDEYEVDVRGNIQLPAAELAHADDDKLQFPACAIPRRAELRVQLCRSTVLRGGDRRLSEVAHGRADLGQCREPREVTPHYPQQHTLPQPAQVALGSLLVGFGERHQRGVHLRPRERLPAQRIQFRRERRVRLKQLGGVTRLSQVRRKRVGGRVHGRKFLIGSGVYS